MIRYIQRRDRDFGFLETVSECQTLKEARVECSEYRLSDPAGYYYVSSRACKDWYEKEKANG